MTGHFNRIIAVALLAGACKPAERAPKGLEEAATDLFTLFDTTDTEELALTILDLEAEMASTKDLDDLSERSFQLDPLEGEALGTIDPVPETEAENQLPALVVGMSTHDYEANKSLAFELNQVCIESNTTEWYGRTITDGEACFADGSCEYMKTSNEVLKKASILATAWYDLFKDYRTVQLEDGREALIARSWTEEVFFAEGRGGNNFAQNFTVELWLEDPDDADATQRVYAIWAEVNIGLPDEGMRNLTIGGLDEGMVNADEFLDGVTDGNCTKDRDREYDRGE